MNFKDFNLDKKDSIFLIVVAIYTLITLSIRINTHMVGGLHSPDVSIYLMNALSYAKMDYYHIADPANLYYSPLICMLTAVLFKLGIEFKLSILLITALFCFVGPFGLYILLKNKFSRLLSLAGVILYSSFSIVVVNLSGGYIDVPAVSMGIWIMVFLILAVNKNPKYFLVLTPLFILGFFTRYTVGFTLPVIVLYYMINRNFMSWIESLLYDRKAFKEKTVNYLHSSEFKYIVFSIVIAIIIFAIICSIILMYGGSLSFIGQSQQSLNTDGFTNKTANYVPNTIFYFKHFRYILFNINIPFNGVFAYFTYLLVLAGVAVKGINAVRNLNLIKSLRKNKISFKNPRFELLLKIILVLSVVGFFVGFRLMKNNMVANISLFIMFFILFSLFEKYGINKNRQALNLLFVSWFAFYIVFITIYPIKVYRYALPLLPPFVYFVIWGLDCVLDVLSNGFDDETGFMEKVKEFKINKHSKIANVIPIIFMVLLMVMAVSYILPLETGDFSNDLVDATDYIMDHDGDYRSKGVIAPYRFASISQWYLQTNVTSVTAKEIGSMNATYLITDQTVNETNYKLTEKFGMINLYTHV